jgi:HAE1 family hydrophobic/amphiphilic exporter-1
MGGVLGRLFREFSVTICVSILISGVVSITLTPMLCSRFLKAPSHDQHGWLYRITEKFFDGFLHLYDVTLQAVLRHRLMTMATFVIVLVATVWMFIDIPKGFIPDQDTDQISVITEALQGTSFYQMEEYQQQIATIVRDNPNVAALMSTVGGTAATTVGGPNFGQLLVRLKPRSQRTAMVNEVIKEIQPKVDQVPGMKVYLQNPPTIRIGGQVTKSLYQFSMQSPVKPELFATAGKMQALIAQIPGVRDVTSDVAITSPQVEVNINRDKAGQLQVSANSIESAFYDAYGPHWVSTIYAAVNEYEVLLELEPAYQADPNALSMLYFKGTTGTLVPLDTLATLKTDVGPQAINHNGQLTAATISFDLQPGVALGQVVSEITDIANKTLPSTISFSFQGAAKAFESSLGNLWVLLMIAIVVVYIVLGILYESYIHPITILSGLPSAGFGALITLYLFKMDLNIYAFVGLIMLIGIVKKNAIMQIDFALDAERNQGMDPDKAIYEGCLIRFRPIMMTTMAALLGAVPIAVGWGAGGEARQSLGLVVVGGLLFSQLVTLYLTPVFYTYMSRMQEWVTRSKNKPVPTHSEIEPAQTPA